MSEIKSITPWWGEFDVPFNTVASWRIGPMNLWIQRLQGEWRSAFTRTDNPLDPVVEIGMTETFAIDEQAEVARYADASNATKILVSPTQPDRPMVNRPDKPFYVPKGQSTILFVSCPLWFKLNTGVPNQKLFDIPIFRPSDTWFGPRSHEGELCYANRTFCRIQLDQISFRPHRAVTAITVKNSAGSPLALERIKIPSMSLALYVDHSGRIWTQDVTLERKDHDEEFAELAIVPGAPKLAEGASQLAPARAPNPVNVVMRAFNSIFR